MTLLTREALEKILVAVDTDLCRSVLLAAVLSTGSASTKTLDYESLDMTFLILGLVTKSHRSQAT